jgi:RNase P/RNase MRP subunit p29
MLHAIGTKSHFDFGSFVFEQTLKHGDSYAVKMPIAFPCLLTELIISQHPDIVRASEEESPKSSPLNFDYRLFVGTHVRDIEDQPAKEAGISGMVSEPVKEDLLSELIDISKALQETISICTAKKTRIDKLIMQLEAGKDVDGEEEAEEEVGAKSEDEEEVSAEKAQAPDPKGKGPMEEDSDVGGSEDDTSATDSD